jgi:hypothetical protein
LGVFDSKRAAAAAFQTASDFLAQTRQAMNTKSSVLDDADKIFAKARSLAMQAARQVMKKAAAA